MLRLRARYATVDEQLHNLTLQDSVPGAVHLSVSAVPPPFPSISGVMKIAFPLAFGGVILGLLAALIANNLDNKIYIAADVERVLGFAPMAVLPDFNQVTDGVAEEHLLRLSAGIEYARQQGHLKSCIFTGTGPDAGVTTVATKVRSMLEGMGRATVLVDATGTPPPPQRASYAEAGREETSTQLSIQRGGRSTALVQQLAQEAETKEEVLVLTDAAPLVVSAETEYLARFVDAAIVVIESGVTTRKELREAAGVLQRLDVAAVGFVLNRVGLEKADPSFRQSVRAVEQHLQAQSLSFARGTERNVPSAPAVKIQQNQPSKAVAATAQSAAALPKPVAEAATRAPAPLVSESAAAPSTPASFEPLIPKTPRAEELVQRATPPVAPAAPLPLVREKPLAEQPEVFRRPEPPPPVRPASAQVAADKVFSAVEFEAAAKLKPARQAPPSAPQASWAESWKRVAPPQEEVQNQPAPAEAQEAEPAETPYDATTRMSGLRNLIFSLGLKNSPAAETAGDQVSQPLPAVEPVHERPVFDRTDSKGEQIPVREEAAGKSATVVTAQPEILSPRVFQVETDSDRTRNNAGTTRRDRRDAFDEDVQILPSWRGQYRKKL
jgi:Mrp family chromosome partitioning ATPase